MQMRCKFRVSGVFDHRSDTPPGEGVGLSMSPVYDPDGKDHENHRFWKATPSGEFTTVITNPSIMDEIAALKHGDEFYLDLVSIPRPEPFAAESSEGTVEVPEPQDLSSDETDSPAGGGEQGESTDETANVTQFPDDAGDASESSEQADGAGDPAPETAA